MTRVITGGKMKKLLALIIACVFTLICFASCKSPSQSGSNGGNNGSNGSAGETADYTPNIDMTDDDYNQTATLTVGVTADPYETDLVNALGAAFKQLFPNVTIEPVRISGSDYSSAVIGRYNAKNIPDIFYTSETESFRFISSKLYLNLDPYIKAENEAYSPADENAPATWSAQFVSGAMKLGQKNYSGAQYFIPRSSDRIVTHLNMKYVKAALEWDGRPDKSVTLDTVKNGWTWEEFVKVCEAIRAYYDSKGWTAANGRYILDASFAWSPVLFSLFKSNGATFYENGKWSLDSDATRATIAMIRELVEKKIIAPTNGGGANYENGSGAMLFHSSSAIKKYKNYIGEDYDIVTFPVINGENGVTGYGVPGYGIYSGIDESKRDLAWQFLSFMLSADGQNALAKAGMNTPSVRADLQDYNTAAWGEGFRDINLAATTYETERNYSEGFFLNFAATTKTGLLGACSNFVNNIMNYNSKGEPSFTAAKCIETALKDLKKAAIVK